MTDGDVFALSARIARALDVTEKRLAIEMAYAKLEPILSHEITDVDAIRSRVAAVVTVLAQHVHRPTVPRPRSKQPKQVAYPDEAPPPAA